MSSSMCSIPTGGKNWIEKMQRVSQQRKSIHSELSYCVFWGNFLLIFFVCLFIEGSLSCNDSIQKF